MMGTLTEAALDVISSACGNPPIDAPGLIDSEDSFADAVAEHAGRMGQPDILGHRTVARAQIRKWVCFAYNLDHTLATEGRAYFPLPVYSMRGKVTIPILMLMEFEDRLRGREFIGSGGSVEAIRNTSPTTADYAMLVVAL